MLFLVLNLLVILFLNMIDGYVIKPGPKVIATKGEIWPKPLHEVTSSSYFLLTPRQFKFNIIRDVGCYAFLNKSLTRYWKIIENSGRPISQTYRNGKSRYNENFAEDRNFIGVLTHLNVELNGDCASDDIFPELGMIENYTLTINSSESSLRAPSIWGILRGLESFSQLVYMQDDLLFIKATSIEDAPRFPYRGLLLDTSRHFLPVSAILQTLDAMCFNKMNAFHWHITDDQSFPFRSHTFPELSEKGAYHPDLKVYEPEDVKNIIEYARLRGIRVIPEFDMPSHTRSWGISHPELLTQCYSQGKPNGDFGPMDPTKASTYTFLTKLYTEIVNTFPDPYIHLGGDEVHYDCWQSNPAISEYMNNHNIPSYRRLASDFFLTIIDTLDTMKNVMVWEEAFYVNGFDIPDSTIIHIWRNTGFKTINHVTAAGKYAIFSACWYLDHLSDDWQMYYNCEPLNFPGTDSQKKLVLGGEVCMWGELVNEHNLMPRVWPRASAAAERLWSPAGMNISWNVKRRLEEHSCRMNKRGIPSEPPNGPGVCL